MLNIFLCISGGTSIPARRAFPDWLLEVFHRPDADAIQLLNTLNEGVNGYTFDLVPLRRSLEAEKLKMNPLAMLLPSTHDRGDEENITSTTKPSLLISELLQIRSKGLLL